MKPIVYFFGTLSNVFASYPQDHTKPFFSNFVKKARLISQIVIHREGNLLYYGYVHQISDRDCIGICLCLDCIYTNVEHLFSIFDNAFATLIERGEIVKIDGRSNIVWATDNFHSESVAITECSKSIIEDLKISKKKTQTLPPVNFSISVNDCLELSLDDTEDRIVDATTRYHNLFIARKATDIARITSFKNLINIKNQELKELNENIKTHKERINELKSENTKLKNKQRNTTWVGILGIICTILFAYIYVKVINPSEVTHYQTGEFVYYGPMKDKKPHGVGVAIYPSNDKDGRKYYIGRFKNGERDDTTAVLFYQDGDYYYGSMKGDKWDNGMLYMNSDKSHFTGTFDDDNVPCDGAWYEHRKAYRLINGRKAYSR